MAHIDREKLEQELGKGIPEQQLPIHEIKIGDRYRKDLGDLASLAKNIRDIGLLHPVVVTPGYQLIAGHRRLEAVKELGWPTVPVRILDLEQVVRGEYAENYFRKDFTPSEAVAIGEALEELEKQQAKARQQKHGKTAPGKAKNTSENFSEVNGGPGEAKAKVAQFVGMSRPTYEKAKRVVEAAKNNPEEFQALKEEMDRTGKVDRAYRKLKSEHGRQQSDWPRDLKLAGLKLFLTIQGFSNPGFSAAFHSVFEAIFKNQHVPSDTLLRDLRRLDLSDWEELSQWIADMQAREEKQKRQEEEVSRLFEEDNKRIQETLNYIEQVEERWLAALPAAAGTLGLSWPCTEEEVRTAYREQVKACHPDTGGNQQSFEAVQKAKECLLAALSKPSP
jgi:ParB-like chromosome segregation protein Spo0J